MMLGGYKDIELRFIRDSVFSNLNIEEETENETSNFYTGTKSVTINSTRKNDPSVSRKSGPKAFCKSPTKIYQKSMI